MARAALIASVPGDQSSVRAAVTAFPQRFYGYAMVNPLADGATAVLEGAPALHAICLFPAMHRYCIQDARVEALLAAAETLTPSPAVFVHCGVLTVGVRKKLGLPSLFDMRFSNPLDLHAVALAHPQLRFIVPHFGAGMFREALMLADLCPNVYLDTSSSNSWMRYVGLDLRTVFRRALDVVGATRLLFGSDSSFFPRGWHGAVFRDAGASTCRIGCKRARCGLDSGRKSSRNFRESLRISVPRGHYLLGKGNAGMVLAEKLRHPLFPKLRVTRAAKASGRHAVLAGTMQELAAAARAGGGALHAVLILADAGTPLPGPAAREKLWQWFAVPSFVLVLGPDGRVLAYECEARDGLHIAGAERRCGDPEPFPCPCGRPGRRIHAIPAVHIPRGARTLRNAT